MTFSGLASVFAKHLQALREPGEETLGAGARLLHVGLPLLIGLCLGSAVWLGMPISNGVSPVLAALALLVGGMMTTFVFLTNLRIKVDESDKLSYRRTLQRLIAGTVAGSLYVAVLALSGALLLVLVGSLDWLRLPAVAPFTVGVVAALGTHLGVNMVSIVGRLWAIYHDVFFKDFGPEVDSRREGLPQRRRPRNGSSTS